MSPAKQMRIVGQWGGRLEKSSHHKRANLKKVRVGVRRGSGKMSEATVSVAATQSPLDCFVDRLAAILSIRSELVQSKHRIESRMTVTRRHIEQPASVGFLIAKRAFDHLRG